MIYKYRAKERIMNLKHLTTEELQELLALKKGDIKEEIQRRKESLKKIPGYKVDQCFIKKTDDCVYLKRIMGINCNGVEYQHIFILLNDNTIEVYDNEYDDWDDFTGTDAGYEELDVNVYDTIYGVIAELDKTVEELYANCVNNCLNYLK